MHDTGTPGIRPAPGTPANGDTLTLTGLLTIVLRQRWLIVRWALGLAVVAILVSLLLAAYVARGSFTPASQSSGLQGLAQVAQSFGVNVGAAAGGSPSLDFYVAVVKSRELLTDLLRSPLRYPVAEAGVDSASTTLLELYGFDSDTSRRSMHDALARARDDITVSADPATGIVSFSVRARSAGLAEAISRRLLDLVNEFNVRQLQTGASTERRFVQDRAELARRQLQVSEDSLRDFLERNRSYGSSPRLRFELQRLERVISLRQQLYMTLAQALEQARISEVRDTPVITIVDAPEGSAVRERHMARNGALGLLAGLAVGLLIAFGREHFRLEQELNPADYEEFRRLRQQAFRAVLPRRKRVI